MDTSAPIVNLAFSLTDDRLGHVDLVRGDEPITKKPIKIFVIKKRVINYQDKYDR